MKNMCVCVCVCVCVCISRELVLIITKKKKFNKGYKMIQKAGMRLELYTT